MLYANRVVMVEAHKVELVCNAEVILGFLYPDLSDSLGSSFGIWSEGVLGYWIPWASRYNTIYCACFVVPRESSVNGCLIPPSLPC